MDVPLILSLAANVIAVPATVIYRARFKAEQINADELEKSNATLSERNESLASRLNDKSTKVGNLTGKLAIVEGERDAAQAKLDAIAQSRARNLALAHQRNRERHQARQAAPAKSKSGAGAAAKKRR